MHRVLFNIGNLTVYSYGVMMALGFIAAVIVARQRLSETFRNPDIILDLVLGAVVGGIVGARLFYIVGHWSYYMANKGEILKLNMDGLVFYGGLLLGFTLAVLVGRWRNLRFWEVMDLGGLTVPLALAIGRIGCTLNGCCYGKQTSLPWGITYPATTGLVGPRHPTQVYELILDLGLFAFLWWKRDSWEHDGTSFLLFVMGYATIRFTMEFFREHTLASAAPMFQIVSAALFLAAGTVLLFRYRLLPATGDRGLPL